MSKPLKLAFLVFLPAVLASCGNKEEPRTEPAPLAAPAVAVAPPAAPKPAPVKAKPKPAEPVEYLKEIVDPASTDVAGSKLPTVIYYYATWSPHDRKLMGVVEEIAVKYKGQVKFFRIDVMKAKAANTLPAEVVAMPYLVFQRPGKERQTKLARPDEARKELEFFISEWLED